MLRSMPLWIRRVRWLPRVLYGLPLVLGCHENDLAPPPPPDVDTLFWDLRLSHHAVTLSTTPPYDTLTLTATPRNYAGVPLTDLPAPVYTTSDARSVLVTSEGELQAGPLGGFATVTATLTVGNAKHADVVSVLVVDNPTPPVLGDVSIHPLLPDSAKRAVTGLKFRSGFPPLLKPEETDIPFGGFYSGFLELYDLPVRATDTANHPIPGLVHLESANTTILAFFGQGDEGLSRVLVRLPFEDPFSSPWIRPLKPGVVTLYASATMFGVTKVDTLQYHVGWPLGMGILVRPDPARGPGNFFLKYVADDPGDGSVTFPPPVLAPAQVRIDIGGVVAWRGDGTEETEVVFDDPTKVRAYETLVPSLFNPVLCDPSNVASYPADGCAAAGDFMLSPGEYAYRVFPVAGVYEFHNPRNGARGQIVVGD